MLVDSGADFSVILRKLGSDLGYDLADGETLLAHGIGGDVDYVLRSIQMTIDGYIFLASMPLATK